MTDIERSGALYNEDIDSKHYLASLLKIATERELITQNEFDKIKAAINSETARVIVRYSKGKSTSVRSEVAATIAESVAFTVSMALKKEPTPILALKRLTSDNMLNIFLEGAKTITTKINYVKHICSLLSKQIVYVNNDAHCEFIGNIGRFLKQYNPDYSAHFTVITEDYPVAIDIDRLAGIEFIAKYIEAFYYENRFLSLFGKDKVNTLLSEKKFNKVSIYNVFKTVFCIALFRLISDMPLTGAPLSESDKKDVAYLLKNDSGLLIKAKDELYSIIKIKEDGVKEYADFCFDNFIYAELKNGSAEGYVNSIFG